MATKLQTVGDAVNALPDTASLASSMAAAFAEIEGATKSANNPHFKSKYADLTSIIEAVKPALIKHRLFFTQRCHPDQEGVTVETVLHHASGEQLSLGSLYVPANKRDAQGFGSALTYARRYSLQTAFGVPTEDDDGNAAARTTANPTTGETPPAKRVELAGPYTSKTALQAAAKQFVMTLERMGDLDDFIAWQQTPEVVEFCVQLERDMPDWWRGGPSVPAEFVPLEIRIAQKKLDLEQIAALKEPA
jgi:hypothetical protein